MDEVTFSQATEGYFIAARARRLSGSTVTQYAYAFRRFLAFSERDPLLGEVRPDDVRAFLNSLDGLAPKSVLNIHIALSALWTWAMREGLIERNVVRDVVPPRPDRREIIPYTEADVRTILAACERTRPYERPGKRRCDNRRPTALRDRAIIVLLVDTGIRASELCNLRIYQADLENQRITVTGKGRKERVIPISPRTAQQLWRYLTTREDAEQASGFLFVTGAGRRLTRYSLSRLLRRIGERAGVVGVNVHRFRHTFAIEFLRNRGNAFALQRMLGHSRMDMVNRYLAFAQADLDNAHREASPVGNWLL